MVLAASEEWVDETVFRFSPSLPKEISTDELVKHIIDRAVNHPDLNQLIKETSSHFSLSERDALMAIDRALGGICRAATLRQEACPDCHVDPVGAAAFIRALDNHSIIDSIYPGWTDWESGYHSATPQIVRGASLVSDS